MSRDFVVVIRPLGCGHVFRSISPPADGDDVWCYACAAFSEVGGDERLVSKARTQDAVQAARYAVWQRQQEAAQVRARDVRPRKTQTSAPRPPPVTTLDCGHPYVSNASLQHGDLVFCRVCSATAYVR